MKLQMIGCSHQHTDVAFREKLAFQPNQVSVCTRFATRIAAWNDE